MQAYRWLMTEPGAPLVRQEFDPHPADPGEVVVQIAGCGVCHTDLGYYFDGVRTNHPLPLALGHEISGRVVETAPDARDWLGAAVIVPAVIPCGTCGPCQRGRPNICRSQKMPGNDIQGGFASHIRVPGQGTLSCRRDPAGCRRPRSVGHLRGRRRAHHPVPGSEPRGRDAGNVWRSSSVQAAWAATARRSPAHSARRSWRSTSTTRKLAALRDRGAHLTLNARELDHKALKSAITGFAKAQGLPATEWFVFECSGSAAGQLTAFGLLVPGATLSVVGFTLDKVEVRLSNLMAFDARAIGNWGCPPELYPPALDLVLDGKVQVRPFIESHPLDDINHVFHAVHQHEIKRRAVLIPAN